MERNVIDVRRAVCEVVRAHQFGPCKFAHDEHRILLVVGAGAGTLPRHLATCEIEKVTGLTAAVCTLAELSPGECSKLEAIGVLVG